MMEEETAPDKSTTLQARNPLTMAMLFYIVTVGGIVSASMRTLPGNAAITNESLFWICGIGIVVGFVLGSCLGFLIFRKSSALLLGSAIGAVVGAMAGGLTLVETKNFLEISLLAFGGCWLLVVVMLLSSRINTGSTIARFNPESTSDNSPLN